MTLKNDTLLQKEAEILKCLQQDMCVVKTIISFAAIWWRSSRIRDKAQYKKSSSLDPGVDFPNTAVVEHNERLQKSLRNHSEVQNRVCLIIVFLGTAIQQKFIRRWFQLFAITLHQLLINEYQFH